MTTTHANPLANLTAAEAGLVNAIDAATAKVERIATVAIDSAIARLEDAVRAVHGRIGAAVAAMHNKVAEVVAVMRNLADETNVALAFDAKPATTVPAQIAGTTDPSRKDTEGSGKAADPVIDLTADGGSTAQDTSQDVAAVESNVEPPTVESATHEPSEATPDATPSVAVAACSAVEPESADQTMARVLLGGERHREEMARDDRRPLPDITTNTKSKRKPRGKRGQADADASAAGRLIDMHPTATRRR